VPAPVIRRLFLSAGVLALTSLAVSPAAHAKPPAGGATGTGAVFKVNPVQSSGDQSLTDQKDAADAVPATEYATVQLRNLDGSGYLRGTWVNVRAETGDPAYSPTGSFVYDRSDDRFEQVMAYFWTNQAQEYLRTLGFGSTLPAVNAESQDVRTNQWGQDNSFSWDRHDIIRLGKGGVDDAEDAEVIVHEYGHAVHDAQVAGFGSSLEAGSIGEGFGDYLAVTVGLEAARQYGWPVNAPPACVADWDSVSYTSSVPHCLRRVDRDKVYSDRVGRVHADGEIWSRALWDIRGALGPAVADRIIVNAQFRFAPDTSFHDAAEATIATAQEMAGNAAAAKVGRPARARRPAVGRARQDRGDHRDDRRQC
jgi:hypothetical protein